MVGAGTLSITTGFLDDSSNVFLSTGSVFDLNFTGTDTIGALSFDGTFQELGTWGSLASAADHKSSLFSGTGMLLVTAAVPEPSTISLGLLGLFALACGLRRRSREQPKAKPVG